MSRLVAQSVTVRQGSRVRLSHVDLVLPSGHVHAIVGPNGSGKSTLLAVLAGELTPTSGRVLIDGRPWSAMTSEHAARLRALLAQEAAMPFAFTVADVVSWGRLPWRQTSERNDDRRIIEEVCDESNLTGMLDRTLPTLSAGERARVQLARVLAQRAPVLMLDEPDAALDLMGRDYLARAVRRCKERGDTVVMTGHDLNWLGSLADSVTVLSQGCVVAQGRDVLTPEVVAEAFGVHVRHVQVGGRWLLFTV